MRAPHFLLVGNGPYSNRGCEAIVRGTMVILRGEFGARFRVTLVTFETADSVAEQSSRETDPLITHVPLRGERIERWSLPWWRKQMTRQFMPKPREFATLDQVCGDATCALQIGGDNYTLDYGRPREFMRLDEYLRQRDVPVVLWGASVGPFEADPAFAPAMFDHLRAFKAILVRESDSYQYLTENGVTTNLHRTSDPAFLMEAVKPPATKLVCQVAPGVIGLNLSPMMAKYVTGGDLGAWVKVGAEIVRSIVRHTQRDVLLIPHVTWASSDDVAFLRNVATAWAEAPVGRVSFLGGNLSAAETKWVISRCAAFAGARTHSTIAAISSAVPTLSLAYSRKARGLNQDIFGTQDYCLQPAEISPEAVAERLVDLLDKHDAVSNHLAQSLPQFRAGALGGGRILRHLIKN
jgi:colanic acid/amylovoran biosynthesis protein